MRDAISAAGSPLARQPHGLRKTFGRMALNVARREVGGGGSRRRSGGAGQGVERPLVRALGPDRQVECAQLRVGRPAAARYCPGFAGSCFNGPPAIRGRQ